LRLSTARAGEVNLNLLFVLYYAFKLSGPVVSGVAAPGLFFAIGGLIALGLSIYKERRGGFATEQD